MPNKNTAQCQFDIQSLAANGFGISEYKTKPLYVRNALPGERVQVARVSKRKKMQVAVALDIQNPHARRQIPECPHIGMCGGCVIQHMAPDWQIEHKIAHLKRLLDQYQVRYTHMHTPILGPIYGYRRKARLGVRYVHKKSDYLVGFREIDGRFLADITSCRVLHPAIGNNLLTLRALIASLSIGKAVPQIEITVAENATAIILRHLMPLNHEDIVKLRDFGLQSGWHIYTQSKGYDSLICQHPHTPVLFYTLAAYDLTMHFHVYDFIQVNHEVNQKLIQKAIEWLQIDASDHILEGFCGIGNFSLPFARYARYVTALEADSALIAKAKLNAAFNKIENVCFLQSDLYQDNDSTDYLSFSANKCFLDPPRSGAGPWLARVLAVSPEIIVYVSCEPTSFAQDAQAILQAGYKLKHIAVADMFVHTAHIETIAQFVKQG